MDRASQVLAQDVPPGVPKSYRALADHHGNVSHSTIILYLVTLPSLKSMLFVSRENWPISARLPQLELYVDATLRLSHEAFEIGNSVEKETLE